MNYSHTTQRGMTSFFLLAIIASLAFGAVTVSKYFGPTPQTLPKDPLANLVRGYIAMQVPRSKGVAPNDNVRPPTSAQIAATRASSSLGRQIETRDLYLPGVTVFLEDPKTQKRSKEARTDLSGRFTLYAPEPGRYSLCWKSDVYDSGCSEPFVTAGLSPQFLSTVPISAPSRKDFVAMMGHVTNRDGSPARTYDPLLNINSFATVSLDDDSANRLATVFVNNYGDYLLPYVPVRKKLTLTASIEEGKFSQEIRPEAQIESAVLQEVNMRIANSRPTLNPLIAFANGQPVQNAAPGSEISVTAHVRDDDGDAVGLTWSVDPGSGELPQTAGSTVKWRVPQTPGLYNITVVAHDKKGGYDKGVISVPVGFQGIPFSGIVVDRDGAPIDQAEVEIVGNPVPAKTGPDGRFSMYVLEARKYVCNVRKLGYGLNSQVYDRGISDGRWVLRRGQIITIDPTRDQEFTNERTQADCPGPSSARARLGVAGDSLKEPEWQDGGGHVIDSPSTTCRFCSAKGDKESDFFVSKPDRSRIVMPRDLKLPPCGPGVKIKIPANSILDPSGIPAKAPFSATIATVDLLSAQQMPGNDSVVPLAGGGAYLKSYGAGSLTLPAGFELQTGALATLTIPVDRARLMKGTLPPTVPLLSYNETTGSWDEEDTMALSAVSGVPAYVGKVKHFSEYNADTFFGNAACLRVFSEGMPGTYDLEVMSPYPDGSPHYKTFANVAGTSEFVIYNITPNANMTLAPMTQGANPHLLGFYIVNSGPPENPPSLPNPPLSTPQGYTSCKNFVVLRAGNAPSSPFGGEFLHGLGFIDAANLGFPDVELTSATSTGNALRDAVILASENYYRSIDPGNDVDTFDKFKIFHGFGLNPASPATNEVVATYANSGDLGFGRDMHCIKKVANGPTNNDVVCYVTNYGTGYTNIFPGAGTGDQADADAAADHLAVGPSGEVATVAMEYSDLPLAPLNKVVKFYVYKKALTNSSGNYARSISANLDGRGERPVPQLCMICHGGLVPEHVAGTPAFGTNFQVNLSSRFLPFDHRLFTFPNRPGLDRAGQELEIKSLNETMVGAVPGFTSSPDPILEVVDALYNDGAGISNSPTQLFNSPVPGWRAGSSLDLQGQTNFYNRVVANACRTCHTAQPFPQLQFNTSDSFVNVSTAVAPNNRLMLGTAEMRVCGDYVMPHALRTHDVFWGTFPVPATFGGFSMPTEFQTFGNLVGGATWQNNLCTTSFVSPAVLSQSSFYQQSIQPIFNGKCVACHIGGFKPLTDGASFAFLHDGRVAPPSDNPDIAGNKLLLRLSYTDPRDDNFDPNNGQRMPQGCIVPPAVPTAGQLPCLVPSDIDRIKAWIRSGAN